MNQPQSPPAREEHGREVSDPQAVSAITISIWQLAFTGIGLILTFLFAGWWGLDRSRMEIKADIRTEINVLRGDVKDLRKDVNSLTRHVGIVEGMLKQKTSTNTKTDSTGIAYHRKQSKSERKFSSPSAF